MADGTQIMVDDAPLGAVYEVLDKRLKDQDRRTKNDRNYIYCILCEAVGDVNNNVTLKNLRDYIKTTISKEDCRTAIVHIAAYYRRFVQPTFQWKKIELDGEGRQKRITMQDGPEWPTEMIYDHLSIHSTEYRDIFNVNEDKERNQAIKRYLGEHMIVPETQRIDLPTLKAYESMFKASKMS